MHVLFSIGPLAAGARAACEQLEHLIRGFHADADLLLRAREIAQIADPQASAPVLVFISRPDAPPCRPDLVFLLTGAIEELVIGEREMRALGDVQLVRSEEHTSELQSRGHLVCRL